MKWNLAPAGETELTRVCKKIKESSDLVSGRTSKEKLLIQPSIESVKSNITPIIINHSNQPNTIIIKDN